MERLADTPHTFPVAMDLGCHTGTLAERLKERKDAVFTFASDISADMAELAASTGIDALVADEERLPIAPASLDLVMSALSLHWVNDLPGTLVQIRHALKPDGLFLAGLFAAGTLAELRTCLAEAELEITGGAAARIAPLPGVQDMAALMQRAGFALPVVDAEPIIVRYADPQSLLDDLGGMAERAAFAADRSAHLPRAALARALELYRERFSDPDGRVRATFNLVYLSGWAPGPHQPQPKPRGSAEISLTRVFAKPR